MSPIFSHPFDITLEVRHLLSVVIACLCGLAIGRERKSRNKQAGIKTHVIVALTSCLMMIISKEAFLDTPEFDSARVAAQIVSGISFIGGGIIFMRDKKISGVTTAAGIWATAGIGMAIGGGMWIFGVLCCGIVVLVQMLTHVHSNSYVNYDVKIVGSISSLVLVHDLYDRLQLDQFSSANIEVKKEQENPDYELTIQIGNDTKVSEKDVENLLKEREVDIDIKRIRIKTCLN